jgi:hypothetical protein
MRREGRQPARDIAAVDGTPAFSLMPAATNDRRRAPESLKSPSLISTNGNAEYRTEDRLRWP